MPTVEPGSKILVSGSNGYIALWVVRKLLEQGYSVRGAVRSEEKARYLKEYFASYGDKVECVIVEDIVKEGAFDEAVKGVDGIEHMASPLNSPTDDPDDYIVPALQGTIGILKSVLKEGTKVKRIVMTSSVVALLCVDLKPPHTFDESSWGDDYVEVVKQKGKNSNGIEKYRASKTLSEQAAWEFYKQHKSEISWDLVTLLPPFVLGPPLQEVKSPKHLNVSLETWFSMIFTEKPDAALQTAHGYIHVEDIAEAHLLALQKPDAGGERIIISAGSMNWQAARDFINKLYPEYYTSGVLPLGNPENSKPIQMLFANEKGKKILGIKYKSYEEIVNETLADFKARGWLDKRYEA